MKNQDRSSAHRVLVVDDNPSIHEDFRKLLCPTRRQSGASLAGLEAELFGDAPATEVRAEFDMDSAFQGQEAIAKVQAAAAEGRPYSLAFMDVRMPPGLDGVETIARIWQEHPAVQMVICTAYSDHSWEDILRKLGDTDSLLILKKPFDNVEVLQLAQALTKKWTMTRQASARMADLDELVSQRTLALVEANQQLEAEIQRRAAMETELRQSEERFHRAFESMSVALGILRAEDLRCLDVNQSFVSLTGLTKNELLDRSPSEVGLLADPAQFDGIRKALQSAEPVRNVGLTIQRKDGHQRQTVASVEPVMLGAKSCLLLALVDVTEQKQLEAQLRQAQKMEAVGQLAAGIAHDFNNLLTVIHGHASLQLTKSILDQDISKAFQQVKLASERASALTRQLLAFSRKEAVHSRPLDLTATVTQLQEMLSHTLGGRVSLECTCAPSLPLVSADECSVEQVLLNLVLNARDAMPEGGVLSVGTSFVEIAAAEAALNPNRHPGEYVVLTVADTGCGMDQQTLSRIFEPFFTTKPIGRGAGLGLATVYSIVKQHGGWLEVESQPRKGSTFRVYLPAIANPAAAEADRRTAEERLVPA